MARLAISLLAVVALGAPAAAGQLNVVSVSPSANAVSAPRDTSIRVTFDAPVDPATVDTTSFWAFAKWSGAVEGTLEFSAGNTTVTLVPDEPLTAGESVMVILSHAIAAADGSPMRAGGYSWIFWTAVTPSTLVFENIDTFSTRTVPSIPTTSYGGVGSDMNNDGHLDLSVINETTEDLRVYLNAGDGTGLLGPMVDPPAPLDLFASPNEPSDFNRDGNTDLCVCASAGDTVTILLGAGDGTFPSVQQLTVGNGPRGNAVLDLDGDGDIDIVNVHRFSEEIGIFLNDGTGNFPAPTLIPIGHDVFG
ncbi:MAG: FG-GAP-like repeat-containing protein, partial [Planctomycetota bacterium]